MTDNTNPPKEMYSVDTATIQSYFPATRFSGMELDFTIEENHYAAHMSGFYTVEELRAIASETEEANKFFGEMKALGHPRSGELVYLSKFQHCDQQWTNNHKADESDTCLVCGLDIKPHHTSNIKTGQVVIDTGNYFRSKREFDCGEFVNEWTVIIVDPDGKQVPGTQRHRAMFADKVESYVETLNIAYMLGVKAK